MSASPPHQLQFHRYLKEYKGNSRGFTGLSGYLIFGFMVHLLGGSSTRVAKTGHLHEFVKGDLKIAQNIPTYVGKRRTVPDISVFKSDEPVGVIHTKIYVTHGKKEMEREIEPLRILKQRH